MRQNIAYYLLLLYLTVMLKPLMPVVGDLASHFFARAYHEATVHAKYGAHHTDKEIANAGAENDAAKHQNNTKAEDPVPLYLFCDETSLNISINQANRVYPDVENTKLPRLLILAPAPPPKFI